MEKAGVFFVVFIFLPALVFSLSGLHTHREHFTDESSLIEKYEVVHPQLQAEGRHRRSSIESLSTVYKNGHRQEITFSVEGLGRRFILQLSRNRVLLPEGSRDSFYNSDGILVSRPFESIDNCYYQGKIKGLPKSTVALSTCEGIEGLIFDSKERFYIQPFEKFKNETHTNPHIMFRMKDLRLPNVSCGQNESAVNLLPKRNISRKRRSIESETKYIELVMVNDYSQYKHYQKNATQRALKIANIVDSLYRPLKVRVALIELITWKDKNEIEVKKDSSLTLDNFIKWRKKELIMKRKLRHDNLQLLTHLDFEGQTVGKAHVLAMCTSRSAGVVQDHSPNTAATAATLAHEMGHNLGLSHDEDKCDCPSKKKHQACIMSGVASHVPATDWSSCSIKELPKMLEDGIDSCLFNYPKKLFGDPVCGNGFKEEGEECDCGNFTECERYTDKCCDPKTCKLLPHADCEQGPCCEKCKFKSSTVMCRKKVSECDLPEYCTGNSGLCPSNKYVYHGRSCDGGKGYCYRGICPTHKSQCQILWGKAVNSGPKLCYTANMKGTLHGSCKNENGVFTPCKYKDIYCGMLHCNETTTDLPIIGSERNAYRYKYETKDGPIECRSATLELGNDVPDPGMAREGTKCGDNKICLAQECVNISQVFLSNSKCPGDCSSHGICNNEGDCFCDDCWGGNDCTKSVSCKFGSPPTGRSYLAAYVILAFLCLALIAAAVGAFIFRDQLKAKWKERQNDKQRRYRTVKTKSSQSPPGKRTTDPPTVTIAPKPTLPPPSRAGAKRQPGKIELPSWPVENSIDNKTITPAQRRQPPGIPKQSSLHRASSPPMGSYDSKNNIGQRPGSYAGVLDTKPLKKPSPMPSPLSGQGNTATGRPLLPSEIKKSQDLTGPGVPSKPARMPPPPPKKPPIPGLQAKR